MGLILVVDPDQEEIVWMMGPGLWDVGQHYAKMLDNGNILVFDNFYTEKLSRIIEFEPITKKVVWDYSDAKNGFFTHTAGMCHRLPNGNTLIIETANGHAFEITPSKKIVWEFYNPHRAGKNKEFIAMIMKMQRLPKSFPLDWLKN